MVTRLYRYVDPSDIRLAIAGSPVGIRIKSVNELKNWIKQTMQKPNAWELIPATFIVNSEGCLRIANRHSEHVACAGGESVQSAGEIFFLYDKQGLEVAEVSNQSTGYCPEPESWLSVAKALDQIPLLNPGKFTTEFVFRRCPAYGQLNVIKDDIFLCAVCNTDLPFVWNCDS